MGGTNDYPTRVGEILRGGLAPRGDALLLTLHPAFQGLPDMAHGGTVLAAFDAVAGGRHRRRIHGNYRRRVPLGVPLSLTPRRTGDTVVCALADDAGATLVDGTAEPVDGGGAPAAGRPPARGHRLPGSASCFACGTDNALGLRAALHFDDQVVGGTWTPRDLFADGDGRLAPVALTTLLDETAFWLGALASGESGMTTELDVILHGDVAFGAPVTIAGSRAAVTPRAGDERYWQTAVTATDAADRVVAEARITFVAVRGAARRLVAGLLRTNPPDVLRRVFPRYTA